MLASIYPNQLLIYLQNIPNLSTMCKSGVDMSVTSALKMAYFVSFHVGVDLSKPTINIFAKYSYFINHVQMWSRHVGDICFENDLFSVFSCWRRFIQTNYLYICKIFLIYQPYANVVSTCR